MATSPNKITVYPLGNADCTVLQLKSGSTFVFDYADKHNSEDAEDKRMPLQKNFREDVGWPDRKEVDVLAITHGDDDHVCGISETFWLDHALKYQDEDRIKIKELWVPAALIVEEGAEDHTRIIRAEARHRFLNKKGIRVFARPRHLRNWLEERGENLDDYRGLITDAGQLVPNWSKEANGIEFFVHSPFAEHDGDALLERNSNCLVMQATIRADGRDTRFLITADSVSENWVKMVDITRLHNNESRLAWDIFKIPHHCSYLSMADEKGKEKTEPTAQFKWLLEQGTERAVMVSNSWEIPSGDSEDNQPPHRQTFARYKDTANDLDADLVVTMENPSTRQPKRTVITIDGNGPTLGKEAASASFSITSTQAPRVG